jgi:hypothetical protein
MELFQIVLPLYDNAGAKLSRALFTETLADLTNKFGGATAFTRSPAEGFWEKPDGGLQRDDVIVVEVLVAERDDAWWPAYKAQLEKRFQQDTILIRALPCRGI